jgi:hypothetical protein
MSEWRKDEWKKEWISEGKKENKDWMKEMKEGRKR